MVFYIFVLIKICSEIVSLEIETVHSLALITTGWISKPLKMSTNRIHQMASYVFHRVPGLC
jgi:hypothetical protein